MSTSDLKKKNITSEIKFAEFTTLLEKISNAKTPTKKTEILKNFIVAFRKHALKFKEENAGSDCNVSFYPILRLLLTSIDRTYGIKEYRMNELYKRIFMIDTNSADGKKLENESSNLSRNSDYAATVYSIIKTRCKQTSNLTIFDVNQHLDAISDHTQKVEDEFSKIIYESTAIEQKWIIRIILKKLSIKFSNNQILSAYDSQAKQLYTQYSNILQVCEIVEGEKTVEEIGHVEIFKPVRPMLCERIKMSSVDMMLSGKDYYLETKMDGERFQLHMLNGVYKYFSRNGKDYTNIYGSDNTSGSLTQYIKQLLNLNVKNFIVDGEMMVWNKQKHIYLAKGENIDVKSLKQNDPILRPSFCIFDILHYNDKCMIQIPYGERINLLKEIFREEIGILTICQRQKLIDKEHIFKCLNNAIDNNEEGIVLKCEDSCYLPGERIGGWYKIKPDYIDGIVVEFDLMIIGGYYTRRKKFLESFLLGVKKETLDPNQLIFYSVGTVRSGLTREQWINLNNTLKPYLIDVSNKTNEIIDGNLHLEWTRAPDVWINPKNSIILQVKASELSKTDSFRTTHTLRFPRIMAIRNDKLLDDCCTLKEFQDLCPTSSTIGKLVKRHITSSDTTTIKKTRMLPQKRIITVENSKKHDDNDITIIKNICHELEFCVLSTKKSMPSIDELELLILKYGGTIVKNPGLNTYAVIAGDSTLRVKKLIESNKYNIISINWLIRALNNEVNELIDFHPNDMISTTLKLELELNSKFDHFTDSYTKQINIDNLKELLNSMEMSKLPILTKSELNDFEVSLMEKQNSNIFRLYTGYFHEINFDESKLAELIFKSRGGSVIVCKNQLKKSKLTHVFIDLKTFKMSDVKDVFGKSIKFINFQWIIECDKNDCEVNDDQYKL